MSQQNQRSEEPKVPDPVASGRLGGQKTFKRYGSEHFQRIGRLGGRRTRQLHGQRYSEFGKKGGRPKRISFPQDDLR